uniref:Uncharacterized protein n=1 Tax=Triticum urartu TaxID=4572 RepID=A0A8R7PA56_TRIUA
MHFNIHTLKFLWHFPLKFPCNFHCNFCNFHCNFYAICTGNYYVITRGFLHCNSWSV